MNNIISIKNLSKIYHNKQGELLAIKDFTYDFKKGDYIAIVGPSGCGKSTILSILAELEQKSNGAIIKDKNIKFGYMLQKDCLFEWKNILDNCLIGLDIQNKINPESKQYVLDLLNTYGLKNFINSYPNNLSGGMRQRVALIRTLATKPDVLLLDEPYSALDYQTRLAVSDDVYKIIKKENKTVIMVTHDIAEAISMANKVIVLSKRPCEIKKIIDINFDNRSNPIENRKNKDFSYYYDLIWKEIDHHE